MDPFPDISPIRLFRGAITLAHMRPGMIMRRREFILGIAMLANVGASAQERGRRIGVLTTGGPAIIPGPHNMFETALKEKGWRVGGNLQIESRITGGDTNLSRAYARELIALQPDVLKLYDRPDRAPAIIGAAGGPEAARLAARKA